MIPRDWFLPNRLFILPRWQYISPVLLSPYFVAATFTPHRHHLTPSYILFNISWCRQFRAELSTPTEHEHSPDLYFLNQNLLTATALHYFLIVSRASHFPMMKSRFEPNWAVLDFARVISSTELTPSNTAGTDLLEERMKILSMELWVGLNFLKLNQGF